MVMENKGIEPTEDIDSREPNPSDYVQEKDSNIPEGWTVTVADLQRDYDEAQDYRSVIVKRVNKWIELKEAKPIKRRNKNKSTLTKKVIRKSAEWEYGELEAPFLGANRIITCTPTSQNNVDLARQTQKVLEHQLTRQIDFVKLMGKISRAIVDKGTCVLKTSWIEKEGIVEEETVKPIVKILSAEDLLQPGLIDAFSQYGTDVPDSVFQEFGVTKEEVYQLVSQIGQEVHLGNEYDVERRVDITVNRPDINSIDIRALTIDPTSDGDIEKCDFIIEDKYMSLARLSEIDGVYFNLDRISSEQEEIDDMELTDEQYMARQNFEFKDKARDEFLMREYWGLVDVKKDGNLVPILASWIEGSDVFIRLEENPMPQGLYPYDFAAYFPIDGSFLGEGLAEILEDSQAIISASMRASIDIVSQTAAGQQGIAYGTLDKINEKRYSAGEDFKFNPQLDPRIAFHTEKPPEVPGSIFQMINAETFETEALSGTKSFSQGGVSGDSLSAVASANTAALNAADKRRLGVIRRISSMIESVSRKCIALNSIFLTDDEIIRITGEEYSRIKVDSIDGRVDLSVKVASAVEDEIAVNGLIMLAQTTAQSMDHETQNYIWARIAELKKQPGLAAKILNRKAPEPNPLVQKREELELQKLEVEIQERASRARENEVDARLKEAKTQVEIARLENIRVDIAKATEEARRYIEGEEELREDAVSARESQNRVMEENEKMIAQNQLQNPQAPEPAQQPGQEVQLENIIDNMIQ